MSNLDYLCFINPVYTLAKRCYPMRRHYNSLSTKTCSVCRRNRWPFPPVSIRHLRGHSMSVRNGQRRFWSNTRHCLISHLSTIHRVFACRMLQDSLLICPTRRTFPNQLYTHFLEIQLLEINILFSWRCETSPIRSFHFSSKWRVLRWDKLLLNHRIKSHRRSTHPKKLNRCHAMIRNDSSARFAYGRSGICHGPRAFGAPALTLFD
jgi:hypothetical protein